MTWRVIDLEGCDIYQMHAAEDYFLHEVNQGNHPPTLLFSRLLRPALSLGIMQNLVKDVDLEEVAALDVDLTRRRTGGRSVYLDQQHYILSIIDRKKNHVSDVRAYHEKCTTIIDTLFEVTGTHFFLCHRNDIMTREGRKVGGVAQMSMGYAYLVHCYLRHTADLDTMLRLIKIDGVKLARYKSEFATFTGSLEQEAGISWNDFSSSFRERFVETLDEVSSTPLTSAEREGIEKIAEGRYKNVSVIHGTGDEPSRGNCDLIIGSGEQALLRIPNLEGKVNFR